ncbi:IS630 family transposase [Aneurinibacillus thermoaerophilus]|uniref:IS630 family transposase n=1 Tax=Aneurinibacillus thermoaerophilus TaxID=143495 RepID=UPI002E24BABD|nr:IS630 family transposase [Aneurinibacillus thermoaerophilus]MED0760922.1 IS630 family transposase [Aneurinibacillus thermoaerophilus]
MKGQQKKILTFGHHVQVTLFGTVDIQTGDMFCISAEKCNAATFLDFLQQLLARYTDKFVILILDNARIHHAKLLRPFLEENCHCLFLLFLPPYSPELNPIEKMWRWLKDMVIVNHFHKNESEIRSSISEFLTFICICPEKVLSRIACTER